MRMLKLSGSAREMGEQFGEASRAEIHELYARRVDNAIMQAAKYGGQKVSERDLLKVAEHSLAATAAYHRAGYEELMGIAHGSDMPLIKVLAMNGLTDFRDVLSWPPKAPVDDGGCTALVVQRDLTGGEVLCGQTWDLATDNLPFVLGVERRPKDGPATISLTTDGCLSLIGLNEHGIAVGTTNIRTTDARPGVNYLSVIHRALSESSLETAKDAVVSAPRAGAHFYFVAGGAGEAWGIECSAQSAWPEKLDNGFLVHANHCLRPETKAIEGTQPNSSSLHRQARLSQLASTTAPITPQLIREFFADHEGAKDAICRDDFDGLNTNGAVVIAPERKSIWLVHGVPSRGIWTELSF